MPGLKARQCRKLTGYDVHAGAGGSSRDYRQGLAGRCSAGGQQALSLLGRPIHSCSAQSLLHLLHNLAHVLPGEVSPRVVAYAGHLGGSSGGPGDWLLNGTHLQVQDCWQGVLHVRHAALMHLPDGIGGAWHHVNEWTALALYSVLRQSRV